MSKTLRIKKSLLATAAVVALAGVSAPALALSPFQQDVVTAINNGLAWQAANGAYNAAGTDAAGIALEALLEKRASGNPADPPQGYSGASAADQAIMRNSVLSIINSTNSQGNGFYAYRDGNFLMALSLYALTGGPDKNVLAPGNPSYMTIKEAMDALTDRVLANQRQASNGFTDPINQGYWCYHDYWCEDSSTTQFASAGLASACAAASAVKSTRRTSMPIDASLFPVNDADCVTTHFASSCFESVPRLKGCMNSVFWPRASMPAWVWCAVTASVITSWSDWFAPSMRAPPSRLSTERSKLNRVVAASASVSGT